MDFSKNYPDLFRLSELGKTQGGKKIFAVEVSINPGIESDDKPCVALIGGLQGSDRISPEILLIFMKYLQEGYYQKESRIMELLRTTRIHFLPAVDFDGAESSVEGNCVGSDDEKNDLSQGFHYNIKSSRKRRTIPQKVKKVIKVKFNIFLATNALVLVIYQ